jgi:hypothetical protein
MSFTIDRICAEYFNPSWYICNSYSASKQYLNISTTLTALAEIQVADYTRCC